MERDTPTIDRVRDRAPGRGQGSVPVPASADPASATMLVTSLRRRPGHVVVTAPFSTTASRLFEMAEPQLGAARIVRLSARLLVESEVARAIVGASQRGLPPPSSSVVAGVVEDAKRQKTSIIILVEDGDAVQVDRLERVRQTLSRTPEMRDVVRLVLLGSKHLRQVLETREAKPFVEALALHLDVSSPDPATFAPTAGARAERPSRAAREPTWLLNEKLLVLAVGAVLVTGVLLFPIEPTVYPVPADSAAPEAIVPEGPASVPEPVVAQSVDETTLADARAAAAPDSAPTEGATTPETPSEPGRQFRPPVKPGPSFQVGAFRDRENALRLAERLAEEFDGVYIRPLGQGAASLYRVRVPIPATVVGESAVASALADHGLAPVRVD